MDPVLSTIKFRARWASLLLLMVAASAADGVAGVVRVAATDAVAVARCCHKEQLQVLARCLPKRSQHTGSGRCPSDAILDGACGQERSSQT